MLIPKQILTPQQHLKLGVGHSLAHIAQSLPGVLVQKSEAYVKHRTAPALDGIIARLIHSGEYVGKFRVRQTRSDKRLVCVAQNRLGKLNLSGSMSCIHFCPPKNIRLHYSIKKLHTATNIDIFLSINYIYCIIQRRNK